jgi:microcystin-dependent protein
MADQFLAEIRIFSGNFAIQGWAFCDGQVLLIQQNTALFALIGTTYGGDGVNTFALPNLQGSAPIHAGQGPGLSLRFLGQTGGEQAVTLLQSEMPAHTHPVQCLSAGDGSNSPAGNVWAGGGRGAPPTYTPSSPQNVPMSPSATSVAGGNQPHNNMPPFLGLTFIIALQGVFPPRV